jgi:NAD/NADP transhydrogenase beta subunit
MDSAADLERTVRKSREARVKYWRVFIVTAFFAVLVGANLFVGAVVIFGKMQTRARAEEAATAARATGKISRPLFDGVFCRTMVFDNNSAETVEDKVERCDQPGLAPGRPRQTQFIWGK